MSVESVVKLAVEKVDLNPSPIRPSWVLEGNPVARNRLISASADGTASTLIWDCTAGRFNWYYDVDETIYVINGGVVVKDFGGAARRLTAGDTIFFPAGARAEWHVEVYIRKIAFCRTPLPRSVALARRGYRFLKRLAGNADRAKGAPGMFGSNEEVA
jgi:uncharacterized cupin superfamily protein